jgi:hypothetical protein
MKQQYGDLALQVGGVSNEAVNMAVISEGLRRKQEWLLWQGPEAIVQ